jgi:LPS-assembly lipoprotein
MWLRGNMRFVFISLICFCVTACGFTPVYQDTNKPNAAQTEMASIDVAVIPNFEGQTVRNFLIDRLYNDGYPTNPEYRLVTSPILERTIEIGIDRDDNASRAQLRQSANFKLIRLNDNAVILNETVLATTGYNILDGSFTTFVTEGDARVQALRTLSDKIIIQLELYFNRNGA